MFEKKNCDQLCVGKQGDMLDSDKLRAFREFADTAYQNAIELHGRTEKAFRQGKSEADYIFSKAKSIDVSDARKTLEDQYRKMFA